MDLNPPRQESQVVLGSPGPRCRTSLGARYIGVRFGDRRFPPVDHWVSMRPKSQSSP